MPKLGAIVETTNQITWPKGRDQGQTIPFLDF